MSLQTKYEHWHAGYKTMKSEFIERSFFIFFSILVINSSCSETACERANVSAEHDFNAGQYSLHSQEILPPENTYFFVLREYYNIKWFFTDSLNYYRCYDSTMVDLLNQKYGFDILAKARKTADSLESMPNWNKETEYPGGMGAALAYVTKRLNVSGLKSIAISETKLFIQFTIDTIGHVRDPKIIKGEISKSIDQQVLDIVATMKWAPAFQYGRPIETRMVIPLQFEFSEQ